MKKSTKPTKRPLKRLTLSISFVLASTMLYVPAYADQSNSTTGYQIQAGLLSDALNQVAQQANVSILFNSRQVGTYPATAFSGNYTADQAFEKLLENTPFQIQKTPAGYLLLDRPLASQSVSTATAAAVTDTAQADTTGIATTTNEKAAVQLAPMVVYGIVDRDTKGYNDIYDADISSVYAGKEQIERYKGAAPADLFKGMVGVYSGDARNSGALDPNVRGIQGPGRVPVTIDGTEQALTVWRGYNGANNRNYIDPNLIGGIQVLKGPSLTRNVNSSVGGAVVVNTLNVNDVLKEDQNFGGEIKLEGSSGSVKPRLSNLMTGQDYRGAPYWSGQPLWGEGALPTYLDKSLLVTPSDNRNYNVFSGEDVAGRIALAGRTDQFEALAAYAYRNKGNHYSGKKGADFYNVDEDTILTTDYIPYFSRLYKPGTEVVNTSSRMESYLFKGVWKPTDEHRLEAVYRDTNSLYGEIMPSRINWVASVEYGVPQWPLSEIESKAYNLEYKYQPEYNKLIDFYSNIWYTDTITNTYSSGGSPNDAPYQQDYTWNANIQGSGDWSKVYPIRNTAIANSNNNKIGITVSNKFNILDNLDLTIGGGFQKEKLTSNDIYGNPDIMSTFRMLPRAGRREEQNYFFNFNYIPISWLKIGIGGRYRSYWAFDDFLNKQKEAATADSIFNSFLSTDKVIAMRQYYNTASERTEEEEKEILANIQDYIESRVSTGRVIDDAQIFKQMYSDSNEWIWEANSEGRFTLGNNKYYNGEIQGEVAKINTYDVEGKKLNEIFSGDIYIPRYGDFIYEQGDTEVKKKTGYGFAPSFYTTINLSPDSRIYFRYSEDYRMPSMFESTVGFSARQNGSYLKPEHTYNYELAYIHDLSDLFESSYADIKFSYFYNRTEDVIERDSYLRFLNADKQILSGIELQTRYDNGLFFSDLSMNYNLKNQVCDNNLSALEYNTKKIIGQNYLGNCRDDGFSDGYLVTMSIPEFSFNGLIGARFFDEKLEIGGRAIFYKAYESYLRKNNDLGLNSGFIINNPLAWDDIWVFDAYANYKIKPDTKFELVGTNLTDKFYIDPLTRSAMAAPGRTVKLALTYQF